ncbi:hypothetical protein [Alicyclobacillus contaminans]|uniref:hypothetical protein n=1 Tax=Alicyclobacillus contaminans TaxID=392016 RepID=UPI00316AE5B8
MHHPLHMECGDPRGKWGRGSVPVNPDLLCAIKEKRLSVYTCHLPMDYNKRIGTTAAMCEGLDAKRQGNLDTYFSSNITESSKACGIVSDQVRDCV